MTYYDSAFYDYVNSGAISSAKLMLPYLTHALRLNSVLDVGCGQGAWLSVWRDLGVGEVCGIDGDYIDRAQLLIDERKFLARDLSRPFELKKRFDLVQSLEVAEHLPASSAADFVHSLVSHGDMVLFSAAAKGQGGDQHINEQDYDYWRSIFRDYGFVALDYLRPQLAQHQQIEPWYRYNTFLYVSKARLISLPKALQETLVPEDQALVDVSPRLYQLRKQFISCLPTPMVTGLAKIKERWVARARRRAVKEGSA